MDLKHVTRSAVLRAINECDRLGHDHFLKNNGFREALEHYLLYDGQVYDSKAIVGVAYRFDTGICVSSIDFTGGRAVAETLQTLGFTVAGDVDWQWPELLVTCDLLHVRGWDHALPADDGDLAELSQFLRSQRPELGGARRFRSPNSVHRKLEDLRTAHPNYGGRRTRGGRPTENVVVAFVAEPDRMHQLAQALRASGLRSPSDVGGDLPETEALSQIDTTSVSALEGAVLQRLVAIRERDSKLRGAKIEQSRLMRGNISCETCGFDFEVAYGESGAGFIQVHHTTPLHFSGQVNTTLNDLVLVCANCHQIIHRNRSRWKTPEELRQIVREVKNRRR